MTDEDLERAAASVAPAAEAALFGGPLLREIVARWKATKALLDASEQRSREAEAKTWEEAASFFSAIAADDHKISVASIRATLIGKAVAVRTLGRKDD
jgi:hypothetical protein